jgi:hypothetical protein
MSRTGNRKLNEDILYSLMCAVSRPIWLDMYTITVLILPSSPRQVDNLDIISLPIEPLDRHQNGASRQDPSTRVRFQHTADDDLYIDKKRPV